MKVTDDVGNWWADWGAQVPDTKVGWRGTNPHPEKVINTIDFLSAKAKAAPFLVGITLE